MKRTNIFELLEEKNKQSMEMNIQRIIKLYENYVFAATKSYDQLFTLKYMVSQYSFIFWKNRGRCLDFEDFMKTIDFDLMLNRAKYDLNSFLTVIEVIYNFYYMSEKYINFLSDEFRTHVQMNELKNLMDICLSDYNYSAFYNKEKEQLIVVEDNPQAVAVAENLESELAFEVIRYNHHILKGDIKTKKHILTIMGSELEPKRKQLKPINGDLEDAIFFILNNANIRHNNISETDKNYRKFIANMSDVELEELYDELYEMMLLANLELENTERMPKMKQLKKDITSNT